MQSLPAKILLPVQMALFAAVALVLSVNDDAMYAVAPKVWAQGGALYRDIPFLQMPLMAILGRAIGSTFGWGALPLTVFNILLVFGAAFLLARAVRGGPVLVAAVLVSGGVYYSASMAGNHALLLFEAAVLAALLLRRVPGAGSAFFAGLIVGLAFSTKLSGLLLLLPLLGWLKGFRFAPPAAAGFLLGALPALYFFAQDPEAFWFMNVTYHQLANEARGTSLVGNFSSLLALMVASFVLPALLFLVLLRKQLDEPMRLLALFLVAGLGMAALPGEVFVMHGSVMQAVGAVVALTWLLRLFPRTAPWLMVAVAVSGIVHSGLALRSEPGRTLKWRDYPIAAEAFERMVAREEERHPGCFTRVLSLAALPAVEGGLVLDPASAAGPFLVTLGGKVPPRFRAFAAPELSPGTIFLAGVFPATPYEEKLVAEAKARGFWPVVIGSFDDFSRPRAAVAYLPPCARNLP